MCGVAGVAGVVVSAMLEHYFPHLYSPPPPHSLYPPLRSGVQVPAGHPASSWMNWTARQAAQKHTAQWQQWSSCLQVLHTAVAQQIFVATSCCVPGVCVVIAQPCAPLRTLMLMQHPRPLSAGDGGARRGGRAGDGPLNPSDAAFHIDGVGLRGPWCAS